MSSKYARSISNSTLKRLVAVCLALGACGTDAGQPQLERATAGPITVVCHTDCGGHAGQALRIATIAWRISAELLETMPTGPVQIHLHDVAGYRAADRRYAGGRSRDNGAFALEAQRSAHIALQPGTLTRHITEVGLPPHTLRLVAHEVFHLVSYDALRHAPRLPDWFSEGAAVFVELAAAREAGVLAAPASDPFAATLLFLAAQYAERIDGTQLRALLLEGADQVRSSPAEYGLRYVVFEEIRGEYPELIDRLRAAADAASGPDGVHATVVGALAPLLTQPVADALAEDVRRALTEGAGGAEWIEGRRHLATAGGRWLQGGFGARPALAVRAQPLAAPYRVTGRVRLLTGPARDGSRGVLLDWTDDSATEVRFTDDGRIQLLALGGRGIDKRPSDLLAEATLEPDDVTDGLRFEIDVADDLVVTIAGVERLRAERQPASAASRWGLTSEGAAAIWEDIEARSLQR